eukprot:6178487-Pleurochrysis_carterae.AAC.1
MELKFDMIWARTVEIPPFKVDNIIAVDFLCTVLDSSGAGKGEKGAGWKCIASRHHHLRELLLPIPKVVMTDDILFSAPTQPRCHCHGTGILATKLRWEAPY